MNLFRIGYNGSASSTILNLLLLDAVVAAYIPQYICILKARSCSGLSTLSILLGALSSTSTLASLLVLPRRFWAQNCCNGDDALALSCILSSILPIMQIMVDRMMASGLFALCKFYEPRAHAHAHRVPRVNRRGYFNTHFLTTVYTSANIALLIPSLFFLLFPHYSNSCRSAWSFVPETVSPLLSVASQMPQFYQMRSHRRVGDLSLKTQAILGPTLIGSALMFGRSVGGSLDESQLVWYRRGGGVVISYMILGIWRVVLLATATYYEWRASNERNENSFSSSRKSEEDSSKDKDD